MQDRWFYFRMVTFIGDTIFNGCANVVRGTSKDWVLMTNVLFFPSESHFGNTATAGK